MLRAVGYNDWDGGGKSASGRTAGEVLPCKQRVAGEGWNSVVAATAAGVGGDQRWVQSSVV